MNDGRSEVAEFARLEPLQYQLEALGSRLTSPEKGNSTTPIYEQDRGQNLESSLSEMLDQVLVPNRNERAKARVASAYVVREQIYSPSLRPLHQLRVSHHSRSGRCAASQPQCTA